MAEPRRRTAGTNVLLALAAFVVVVAGMKAAASILVPFLLAAFLAIICSPLMFWLNRKGVPQTLSVLILIVGIVLAFLLLTGFIGTQINSFSKALPGYQSGLVSKQAELLAWLKGKGVDLSEYTNLESFDSRSIFSLFGQVLTSLGGLLTNAFMILLTMIFILFEASTLPDKVKAATGDPENSLQQFTEATGGINKYMAIKTWTSLLTGVLVASWLWFLGVDYPFLWGLVAFLLNYVPNIGSIIAAVPGVLMALVQFGVIKAIWVGGGYLAVNLTIGSVLEPRFMGRGLGLSTLVVFLSLVFWGWVLGPVGMLLSAPLTMILKIGLEHFEDSKWLAILLSAKAPDISPPVAPDKPGREKPEKQASAESSAEAKN